MTRPNLHHRMAWRNYKETTFPCWQSLKRSKSINAIGNIVQSPSKKFSIGSPKDKTRKSRHDQRTTTSKPELKSSLSSLISEMGFHEKSPEYKACVQFLEAIRPKSEEEDNQKREISHLVSTAESPQKTENMEVLVVTNFQNKKLTNLDHDDRRDDLEEHQEQQNKDEQDNEAVEQQEDKKVIIGT